MFLVRYSISLHITMNNRERSYPKSANLLLRCIVYTFRLTDDFTARDADCAYAHGQILTNLIRNSAIQSRRRLNAITV